MNYKKLYKETNDKFVERVEKMLYKTCGCDIKRGREILLICLERNEEKIRTKNEKLTTQ